MDDIKSTNYLKEILKRVAFKYLKIGKPKYPYMLDPIQLCILIKKIDELYEIKKRPLNIYEIGVARGMTTAFLASHILFEKLPHQIICIDTFEGFTAKDLKHEVTIRGKSKSDLLGFSYNDYDIWRNNFSHLKFVKVVKSDIADYEISAEEDVDVVLADVDLYLPTKIILEKFYPNLSIGGMILVDDVKDNSCWDGAHEAYHEFCSMNMIEPNLLGRKTGLILK